MVCHAKYLCVERFRIRFLQYGNVVACEICMHVRNPAQKFVAIYAVYR